MNFDEWTAAREKRRNPEPKKPKRMRTLGKNGRRLHALDARVKVYMINTFGEVCHFQRWGDCGLVPGRQDIELMHIYGKHTQKGVPGRKNAGFTVLGCPKHHDQHEAEILKITAEIQKGEVYRTFECGDLWFDDLVESKIF